jgi:cytochrome o ubiquinol oxidase subunit 1
LADRLSIVNQRFVGGRRVLESRLVGLCHERTAIFARVGVDYYLWSLQISGSSALLAGINLYDDTKMRAPGMSYVHAGFLRTSLATNLLIVAAFPVLTAVLVLVLDRYLGFHFFTNDAGGNQMLYANLFWVWGHPKVYILVLPAFGSSESSQPSPASRWADTARWWPPLWRLTSSPFSFGCTTFLGASGVNGFAGAWCINTSADRREIYNWPMCGGRVQFSVPVLWSIASW